MTTRNELPSVEIERDRVVVTCLSARDSSARKDSIHVRDIAQVVAERSEVGDESIVHWFLRHREGWTLHFNDRFAGAEATIRKLQGQLGFSIPDLGSIASSGSEGTLVWHAA